MKPLNITPGPWHVGMREGANACLIYAYDGKNQFHDTSIAQVQGMYTNRRVDEKHDPRAMANARLIAAAPALLEKLIQARDELYCEFGSASDIDVVLRDAGVEIPENGVIQVPT